MAGGSHGPSPGQENASCAQRLSKSTASFGSNPIHIMPPFRRSLSLLRLLNDCRLQPGSVPASPTLNVTSQLRLAMCHSASLACNDTKRRG